MFLKAGEMDFDRLDLIELQNNNHAASLSYPLAVQHPDPVKLAKQVT